MNKPYRTIIADQPRPHVSRVTLARPDTHNAQSMTMLYELNQAFGRALADDSVRVIVLAAQGKNFSSGHDLGSEPHDFSDPVGVEAGYWESEVAGIYAQEAEAFLGLCERWRNLAKPTVAQVQGKCIAAGLMLAWTCDLIVASEDATFQDPTLTLGVSGVEFSMHAYELGWRKAKEFLLTGQEIAADEAWRLGMVNRVVSSDALERETLALAASIAEKPPFAVRAAKSALNHAQDQAGRALAMRHSFAMHQLTHADNMLRHGMMVDPSALSPSIAEKLRRMTGAMRDRFKAKRPQ